MHIFLFLFQDSFPRSLYLHKYFFDVVRKKILVELIKRRSKVQEMNMSCEHTLNFGQ